MTTEKAIRVLERNRDANPNSPQFIEACNMAITAIRENRPLKNRCLMFSGASMCVWCNMKCPDLGEENQ